MFGILAGMWIIQEMMISIIFITAADGRHDNGVHDMFVSSRVSVCSKNVLFDLSRLNVLRIVSDYLLRMFAAMFYDRAGGGSCGGLVTDGSRILVTAEKTGTPSHLDPRHHGYSICTF